MEESEKAAELKLFSTTNKSENSLGHLSPEVTVNQIFHANPHHDRFMPGCCIDYFCQKIPCRVEQVNQEFSQPAPAAQHKELTQYTRPDNRRATPAMMNLHHQPPDGCCLRPAETREADRRGGSCYWKYGPYQSGIIGPANRGTASGEDEFNSQLQSDEEDLEPPLPLRSDDELQHYSPFVPPHRYMHNHVLQHTMDLRCYHSAGDGLYNHHPANRNLTQLYHHSAPCQRGRNPQNWLQCNHNSMDDSLAQGSVSVNVPQFFLPPVEDMSQVSVKSSVGGEASISQPHERRRNISLSDVSRNVFITYSSDVSSEIIPFTDFLTKQGFRPIIGTYDNPFRCTDINKWKDSYLKDPSTLIIIAITPKYKADIEGSGMDSHALHTRYVHTMMQNEFIRQGSLNFRFIPVLFLNASQEHVPSWLQNTHVYRWPRDTEDLLLQLLREERFVPPPVPLELALIIRPVAASSSAAL